MSQTTPRGPKALFPDQTFVPTTVVPDALIHQITTPTVSIEGDEPSVRVPYVTDLPNATFTAEDTEIAESDAGLEEVLINTRKLALLHRASRESVTYPDAATMVANWMGTAITNAADKVLLTGTAATPKGLLNVTGIHDGGTMAAGDLDVLSDAITTIEAAGATATHIVMDAASWGQLRKLKTTTGSAQLLLGNPAEQAEKRLFGVPVVVSSQMPAGTVLVVDKSDVLSAGGQLNLATSSDFYFSRDSIAYRVTWRMGWAPIHPGRVAKVAVTIPTP